MASYDTVPHGPLRFCCPRCGAGVEDHWYGPCAACRSALRAEVVGTAGVAETSPYEPPVHVVPNAVAMKD